MKRVKRVITVLALIVAVLGIVLYGGSEWKLRAAHAAPLPQIVADRSPAGIAEGNRLGYIDNCLGCHGHKGEGNVLADVPMTIRLAPPPLARAVAGYSDAELARLIRYGVKRDGSSVFFMPTTALGHIADDDLARIVGWLRTLKPAAGDSTASMQYRPLARIAVLTGRLKLNARAESPAPRARPADAGGYFVHTACLGCHALHREGQANDDRRTVPALATMGAAYDIAAFHKLLHTGTGMSPRDLGLMKRVAQGDLSHLADAEIDQIHAYLVRENEYPAEQ